ncbi:UNVERIFIED_CONTAM: hypothetical protein K2H54_001674 [Gekko kuhli]
MTSPKVLWSKGDFAPLIYLCTCILNTYSCESDIEPILKIVNFGQVTRMDTLSIPGDLRTPLLVLHSGLRGCYLVTVPDPLTTAFHEEIQQVAPSQPPFQGKLHRLNFCISRLL